ncbi:hypothetical protein IFM89_026164 [Coptis chinensis]|uniref:Uncharacterized protein n=1 Tax=Coptis chinensis TaxID=261450 RepID=A0A835LNN2_9MAGN|nr:hypothetical protein IFM89_026164 [Coptis chinensis]
METGEIDLSPMAAVVILFRVIRASAVAATCAMTHVNFGSFQPFAGRTVDSRLEKWALLPFQGSRKVSIIRVCSPIRPSITLTIWEVSSHIHRLLLKETPTRHRLMCFRGCPELRSLRLEIALLGASAVLGLFASACSLPFDYVKSQIQKMQPNATGKYYYNALEFVVLKTWKAGGALKFYNEFLFIVLRLLIMSRYGMEIGRPTFVPVQDLSVTAIKSAWKFGSGMFLLVQVVLLLDFVHGWNDSWVKKDEQFWLVEFLYPSDYVGYLEKGQIPPKSTHMSEPQPQTFEPIQTSQPTSVSMPTTVHGSDSVPIHHSTLSNQVQHPSQQVHNPSQQVQNPVQHSSVHTRSKSARRRERHQLSASAAVDASSGSTSGVKKPRLINSQTTTSHTSISNTTPPRSFDTSSSHQDASFKEALPGQVCAPAVLKCVRVTAIDDGEDEYAYQAVVKIGGHVFKGFLYDQGMEGRESFPNISELHLGVGVKVADRRRSAYRLRLVSRK